MSECYCTVCEELRQLAERRSNLLYPPMNPGIDDHPERRLEQIVVLNRHIARLQELGCQVPRTEQPSSDTGQTAGAEPQTSARISGCSVGGAADGARGGRPRGPAPSQLVEIH